MIHIPIFPLNTVLFPDGILPLRIFEPRYLDMVSECLKAGNGFGVCLIRSGHETGSAARIHKVGTLARVIDFQTNDDGTLGLTVVGDQRFRVHSTSVGKDQLMRGDVNPLNYQDDMPLPVQYQLLADMLRQILEKFGLEVMDENERLNEPYWIGSRLAELLPVQLPDRQKLLEIDDPIQRLEYLQNLIARTDLEQ